MCWDHLVSFSRYSCWCLWSCVFFHHNFLKARCLYLARRKAAWLLVNKKKKKRKRTFSFHTLKSAVDVWILVLDKKGAFSASDRCDCVCARVRVLHVRVKGSREKEGLACVSCIPAGLCIAQDFFLFALAPVWLPRDCICREPCFGSRISSGRFLFWKTVASVFFRASSSSRWVRVIPVLQIYEEMYLCWWIPVLTFRLPVPF